MKRKVQKLFKGYSHYFFFNVRTGKFGFDEDHEMYKYSCSSDQLSGHEITVKCEYISIEGQKEFCQQIKPLITRFIKENYIEGEWEEWTDFEYIIYKIDEML